MSPFGKFFGETPRWGNLPEAIFGGVVWSLILTIMGGIFIHAIGLEVSGAHVMPMPRSWAELPMRPFLIALFLEEVLFRLPLFLVTLIGWKPLILPSMLLLSGVFGWVHGDWTNIPVQGVSGFVYCCVFMHCGGAKREFFGGVVKGLLASYATHTLDDFTLLSLFLLHN